MRYEEEEDLEFVDLDDEEPTAPVRERAAAERPAAPKAAPKTAPKAAPKAAPAPETARPAAAPKAAPVKKVEEIPAVKEEEDDDFEFIDLDL